MNSERLKVLLENSIDMLQDAYNFEVNIMTLLNELGMTREEYEEVKAK
jgi:hypothetical protein